MVRGSGCTKGVPIWLLESEVKLFGVFHVGVQVGDEECLSCGSPRRIEVPVLRWDFGILAGHCLASACQGLFQS